MSAVLDLGTVLGTVDLNTAPFDAKYAAVLRKFTVLGGEADRASVGTTKLDKSFTGLGASSSDAAAGLTRADMALRETTSAATRAADATSELGLAQSKATQAELRATAARERYNELLAAGTATTRQLASAQAALMAAEDRAALSQQRLAKTATTVERYRALAGPLAVAGGLIAAGFYEAGKAATDFDSRMALNQSLLRSSVKSNAELTDAMGQLRHQALTAGQEYGYTATQVADAQSELIKAGISVKDILGGALVGALTLAAAGQEDVAQATETAAIAMTQFKLSGKDVPRIADMLSAGADKALGSVADLSEALKYGGLASAQAGETLQNTIGTLAEFAQAGLMGSSAGSALGMMLQNLQKPSAAAAALMDKYKISLYNANGTTKTYTQLAGNLHDSLAGLPPAERAAALATLFTARARRAATILTLDGADANAAWTKSVNDQGFAALQAAGKLDSLSGDWIKFKAALSSALIDNGQGAQGPLRELVQDATAVINAWERVPKPLRQGAEILAAVGAAAALAGAAALVAVPKWIALNEALEGTSIGAISAQRALGLLTRGGLIAGAVVGVYEAVNALDRSVRPAAPDVDKLTASLMALGKTGKVGSTLADTFGPNLDRLNEQISELNPSSFLDKWAQTNNKYNPYTLIGDLAKKAHLPTGWDPFFGAQQQLEQAKANRISLDQALAQLAGQDGGMVEAQIAWNRIVNEWTAGGGKIEDLVKLFPSFSSAVQTQASATGDAAIATSGMTSQVDALAKSEQTAAEKADKFNNKLKALSDPIFGMSQALGDLRSKQKAYNDAVERYGAHSKQAKGALTDLASSAAGASAAAHTLAAEVKDGNVSIQAAKGYLDAWVKSGILTRSEAASIIPIFQQLIGKAFTLSGINPKIKVSADTASAISHLRAVKQYLDGLHDKTVAVTTVNTTHHVNGGQGGHLLLPQGDAAGGLITGPGTGTSDSILRRLSNGEYVEPAAVTARYRPLLDAMRSGAPLALPVQAQRAAAPMVASGSPAAGAPDFTFIVNNPVPEKISDTVPRATREALWASGMAWS